MYMDSQKTITTAGIAFQHGASNEDLRDQLLGGTASIMQSHHFGHFQGYYGAVFGAGNYSDQGADLYSHSGTNFDTAIYTINPQNRFYGYYGFNGGVNVVVPFPEGRGEWRAIGVDLGYRREFGQYRDFRRQLDPNYVDLSAAYNQFFSVGASTEIVIRGRGGAQFSYRWAAGGMIFNHNLYKGSSTGSRPYYLSQTLALTRNRVTGYIQLTAGTHAFLFQTGVNVSLRRATQAFPAFHRPERERKTRRAARPRRLRPFEKRTPESGE
jgi:large exoprotein involved in heme utilization and adhesion